jgi:hypothetical protein
MDRRALRVRVISASICIKRNRTEQALTARDGRRRRKCRPVHASVEIRDRPHLISVRGSWCEVREDKRIYDRHRIHPRCLATKGSRCSVVHSTIGWHVAGPTQGCRRPGHVRHCKSADDRSRGRITQRAHRQSSGCHRSAICRLRPACSPCRPGRRSGQPRLASSSTSLV